ncbi:MAG TPA: DUF882 domain-containing protein, partial [Desulfomonilia bacterium]|nr:DUF882 domain-containing protein [Desulfomonilia bacterium]
MKKHRKDTHKAHICRRSFLKAGALVLGTCLFPKVILGAVNIQRSPERMLSFYNIHTGEYLKSTYWVKGGYIPEALTEINHILRDFRTGEIMPIDTGLLDLLSTIREDLGSSEQFHIISGYRSAATNALLREHSGGVAGHSLHMRGL